MQLIIGQKDGTTTPITIDETVEQQLIGKRIGEEIDGSVVGLNGYTLEITGGSDMDGFPMKKQLQGASRRKVLVAQGAGVNGLEDGERQRKSLRGNTVSDNITQLNCSVKESGKSSIEELLEKSEESEE